MVSLQADEQRALLARIAESRAWVGRLQTRLDTLQVMVTMGVCHPEAVRWFKQLEAAREELQ